MPMPPRAAFRMTWMAGCLCLLAATVSHGAWKGGRDRPDGRSLTLAGGAGRFLNLEGTVSETKRAYTTEPGHLQDYGHYLESYSFEELGFDDGYASLNLFLEKQWKYVTLQLDMGWMKARADGTARRVYALHVDEILFNGAEYEYLLIPEGTAYRAELRSTVFSPRLLFTPFHAAGSRLSFSPWIHLGVFGAVTRYEIDAGPASGVTTYEAYPYPYVVGGKGEGTAGIILPELGAGAEVRLRLGRNASGDVGLRFQGQYAFLEWSGSSSDLGVRARNAKYINMDYRSAEARLLLDVPLGKKRALLAGVAYRRIEAEGSVEAYHRSPSDQQQRMEKYDKEVDFATDMAYALLGLRF